MRGFHLVINMAKKLVFGVGINDSELQVSNTVKLNNKRVVVWQCEFYSKWLYMLQRCYSEKFKKTRPSYEGCIVCDEWHKFSSFKAWMQQQDWSGKQLDKDILVMGNKVYSPVTCVFVSSLVNSFFGSKNNANGYLDGVSLLKRNQQFRSQVQNPFTGKNESLGNFASEIEAHIAWKKRKHELACQLADLQTDERVANALRARYL